MCFAKMDTKCLLLFLFSIVHTINGLDKETKLISDVVKSYNKPTVLVPKVCWSMSVKQSFAKRLLDTNVANVLYKISLDKNIENQHNIMFVLDMNCQNSGDILLEANENKEFGGPYRWLLLFWEDDWDSIMRQIRDLKIFIDSDVTIAYGVGKNQTNLRKVYKLDPKMDYFIEDFATWSLEAGLVVQKNAYENTLLMRRRDFGGKNVTMSVVVAENSTIDDIMKLRNIAKDVITKSTVHGVLPLYYFLNATLDMIETKTWGYYINDTWNGMIGQMLEGRSELCGTITLMNLKRSEVLYYLVEPLRLEAKFIFRQPPLSLQNNLFHLPFRTSVWICLGALVILLMIVIYINARWELKRRGRTTNPLLLDTSASDVAILVAGAVVQQSDGTDMRGSRGRMIIFIMFLKCLFLFTAYSANIVALLQSSSDQIRTLSDLLNSKLELGVEDQPYGRFYFMNAQEPVRKAIYETKIAKTGYKPNFMPIEEGITKMRNTEAPFAFFANTGLGYKIIQGTFHEHEKCGLREIRYLPRIAPWTCCYRFSPYKELYKLGLMRTHEHGLDDRVNRIIYTWKPACSSQGGNFGSVNMTDFHPVLLYLLYGMISSVTILGVEIYVHKSRLKKKLGIEGNDELSDNEDGDELPKNL